MRYIVTVKFDLEADSDREAERVVFRSMETGVNDLAEVLGVAIVDVEKMQEA